MSEGKKVPLEPAAASQFTGYQKVVAGLLAFLQFAVILDFMIMAPLGALIIPALDITPARFGIIVSAYAFSAGLSGLLAAGFADRFDRKKLLLFFYVGFLAATLWCGLARTFEALLCARIATGLFGGVIGSVVLAIATDLYSPGLRGRVMGIIQTAFAASQVLGLPLALFTSNHWDWHAPFYLMVALGGVGGVLVAWRLKPVTAHLKDAKDVHPARHLSATITARRHLPAFATTVLLSTGGFMIMPFSSLFVVNNLGLANSDLPTIYLLTGICTIVAGPLIGKMVDATGRMPVFLTGSAVTIVMVLIYTNLTTASLPVLVLINVVMFLGIFARMIPYQAMSASVPEPQMRGSFNAISASIQQLSGGVAAVVAGHLVSIGADGRLHGFERVGWVLVATTIAGGFLVNQVNREIRERAAVKAAPEGS
ncbi:MFS transporter [Massilia niabensis]|uniref:MFS transporter n=1 Tax=Massilia niabensis TaxID=544910 RepID=A0ABW0L1M5_9BURK